MMRQNMAVGWLVFEAIHTIACNEPANLQAKVLEMKGQMSELVRQYSADGETIFGTAFETKWRQIVRAVENGKGRMSRKDIDKVRKASKAFLQPLEALCPRPLIRLVS